MPEPERRIVQLPDHLDKDGVLTCPKCGCQDFEVTHTYPWSNGQKRRRRVCTNCGRPITTVEHVEDT